MDSDCIDEDSKVIFSVEGSEVCANKFLLAARSRVFKALLFGQCEETVSGKVTLEDFSKAAFECFLALLEDSSADAAYDLIQSSAQGVRMVEVYALADKYCIPSIKNIALTSVLQS